MRGQTQVRKGRGVLLGLGLVAALSMTACGNSGPPDFNLMLASGQTAATTVPQGGTTNLSFTVAAVKGSAGSITLVLSGLPANVGVSPGSATVGIGSTQVFAVTAASNATVTTTPLTLTATGTSGNPLSSASITHTQTLTLAVTAPPAP